MTIDEMMDEIREYHRDATLKITAVGYVVVFGRDETPIGKKCSSRSKAIKSAYYFRPRELSIKASKKIIKFRHPEAFSETVNLGGKRSRIFIFDCVGGEKLGSASREYDAWEEAANKVKKREIDGFYSIKANDRGIR